MFRGRPPFRGGYPPPFEGRGPPPSRPHPAPAYRDERSRPRPPYHSDYRDHNPPDSYRHYPPRRTYPSPGTGGHRGGEFWSGGPPAERSPSQWVPSPQDHNMVITVGNELTGPPGSAPLRHHDRDYSPRPEYDQSWRGALSPARSRSPNRKLTKSRGRSKSRSPDRSRAKSRGRSKSRPRGQSRSPERKRGKSRGRSKSRSPDRSRAKSRGRSKSRPRGQSRSPEWSRAKSRGQSKSLHRSRSRSRSSSRSRKRNRGRNHGRSHGRSKSRSSSSSSSSSTSVYSKDEAFKELEVARRRKELEELLTQPTKSILKKRNSCDDSPSIKSSDSHRDPHSTTMSHMADQLLQAVRSTDSHTMTSMLSELQSNPHMAQRPGLDAEIKEILSLLGGVAPGGAALQKVQDDIDDEEKFLYGDSEETKLQPEPVRHHSLDLYGDVTEDSLYSESPSQRVALTQLYACPLPVTPYLQATPTVSEVDRYVSQPTTTCNQNITVQVSNPTHPPGTETLEENERQAMEEYEKIQDLLKTIGLDLGVTDISKMAARTKERLQGNKPPPKTPTHRHRYSSGSSDGSRRSQGCRRQNHSGSSDSSSRSRSRERSGKSGGSWSSDNDERKKNIAPPKTHKERDTNEPISEWSDAPPLQPQTTDPAAITPHPGMPIPTYPPSQVHSMMPFNFPSSAYSQYGNYMSYMHQQWPPMYPPPSMAPPTQTTVSDFPPTPPYKQPYKKPAPEAGIKGVARSVSQNKEQRESKDRRVSEEENNESQKQKVLEERENLKKERDMRMKKKDYLIKELERLRKQQGELMRKKRREKDGHKDPLLQEIGRLQEEVMAQISSLRKEHEVAEKKRSEIEKVALILGLNPSDRPSKTNKQPKVQEDEPQPVKNKRDLERSSVEQEDSGGSTVKLTPPAPTRASPYKPPAAAPEQAPPPDPFEYYDAGNHWCKNCNITSGSMFDFFTHLHSKSHRKTLDPYDRPWASSLTKISKNTLTSEKQTKPAKGSEFLVPVRGFYCLLCKQFFGDAICAEEHIITHFHNEKYKNQIYENPLYEQRRNLDRQAALALEASGKKRKHDDDQKGSKEKEEKAKHKKEKKEKEKKEEDAAVHKEEKYKVKKEEEEDKTKLSRKEDFKKNQEHERYSYSKKDEDEKYKYTKKDDKYHYSRDDEDQNIRYKNSNQDEEYQYRHHRDGNDRYNDRPKYSFRGDKDKHKHEKYSDVSSKYSRECNEGKPMAEREADKPAGKPDPIKSEPPLKSYELPKIFCGPSPAMRAKLRKQSLETGKAPSATTSFGKFTWKKKENQLAKEAQKIAAEFLKEDETTAKEQASTVEDSFAKSMAVAKEIAQKLAGEPPTPPSWFSGGRGRIRPNLRAPANQVRKAAMAGKPASLNTFLNMRSPNTSILGPTPGPLVTPQLVQMNRFPSVHTPRQSEPFSAPAVTESEPFGPELPPSMSKPEPCEVNTSRKGSKPDPTGSKAVASEAKQDLPASGPAVESRLAAGESRPAAVESKSAVVKPKLVQAHSKPAAVESKPASVESKLAPVEFKLAPIQVNSAPPVCSPVQSKPAPSETKPIPAGGKPASSQVTLSKYPPVQPAMIKIVSDVAAPGVPESEQTCTMFVKPPPFMNKALGPHKPDKVKSNLAAAKAQDLFGIFYSSSGQQGPSSFTRPETSDKSIFPHAPQPQPQSSYQTQSQLQDKPQPHFLSKIQTQSQTQDQPLVKPQNEPRPQTELQHQCLSFTQAQPPTKVQTSPEPNSKNCPPGPQAQTESDIQITSVWSLQPTKAPTTQVVPTTQPKPALPDCDQNLSQNQTPHLEPNPEPQPKPAPPFQAEPQPDSLSQPETTLSPQSKLKPGPKIRGKSTPTRKTPPASAPARQTRSQTRYQTRQQQQSQPEPELALGDHDSTILEPKALEVSDPESQPKTETTNKKDAPALAITPETLGLLSDMTSLDFDYNFNFE
ncbi:zinc finger protein 318 [Kryptolebias marmoratus]|uniref:Zinc finger protein 318 n=1 Tax=Kryptolebias marmoratus TaxID=37003 RepID=A0A3Q3EEI4_KRYMA|nr:zinc finger protein 318 [Kryptolebias marmoratus]